MRSLLLALPLLLAPSLAAAQSAPDVADARARAAREIGCLERLTRTSARPSSCSATPGSS